MITILPLGYLWEGTLEWIKWLSNSPSWRKWAKVGFEPTVHFSSLRLWSCPVSVETSTRCFHSDPSVDSGPPPPGAHAHLVTSPRVPPHVITSPAPEVSGATPEAQGRGVLLEESAAWGSRGG